MDFDDVGAFDFAQVGTAATFVDAQERFEVVQGAAVDVQVIGEQLADGGAFARLVDGRGIACAKEQFIRKTAGLGVRAEESPHVRPEGAWQLAELRPPLKPGQRQVDEQVFRAALCDCLPFSLAGP